MIKYTSLIKGFIAIFVFLFLSFNLKLRKDNLKNDDYKIISYLINESFLIKSDNKGIVDSNLIKIPKLIFNEIYTNNDLTNNSLSGGFFLECGSLDFDLNAYKPDYFKLNKKKFEFSNDSFQKYLTKFKLLKCSEKNQFPRIDFDKPLNFYINNRTYSIVTFHYIKNRSNGKKSIFLIESSNAQYKIICEKIIIVN